MKKLIISIIFYLLPGLQLLSQHNDKHWYYYWSLHGNLSQTFQLHNPASRWVDTLSLPLTPYTDGWAEFNGRNSILRGGHAPFYNFVEYH